MFGDNILDARTECNLLFDDILPHLNPCSLLGAEGQLSIPPRKYLNQFEIPLFQNTAFTFYFGNCGILVQPSLILDFLIVFYVLGRVFLFKNGSRYAFFSLLLSFIMHELLEEAGAELQLILLIMGYCIHQHLLFVSVHLYLLPPYFHDVPGSICVISHEVITNGTVGFLPFVLIRGINVVVLV